MTDKDKLADLLARVKQATGRLNDETICDLIASVEGKTIDRYSYAMGDGGQDEIQIHFTDGSWWSCDRDRCPDECIDAALQLVERVLPGASIRLVNDEDTAGWECAVAGRWSDRPTAPLAILCALFTAMMENADD